MRQKKPGLPGFFHAGILGVEAAAYRFYQVVEILCSVGKPVICAFW
jgi:hypothetical protein